MEYDFKDAFIVRAMNEENNDFIITIGDRIATPHHFSSRKEAEQTIMKKDWNLIASLAISIAETTIERYLKEKSSIKIFKIHIVTGKQIGRASCRERVLRLV